MADRHNKAEERRHIIYKTVETRQHPLAPADFRKPLKQSGHDLSVETIRHILYRMVELGLLVKFPGTRSKRLTVYGLEGQSTEGLDLSVSSVHERRKNYMKGYR